MGNGLTQRSPVSFQLAFDMLVLQKHNTEMTTAAGEAFYTLVCLHQVLLRGALPRQAACASGCSAGLGGPASSHPICSLHRCEPSFAWSQP